MVLKLGGLSITLPTSVAVAKDTQSRKWQLTINNPEKLGFTHDWIKQILESFPSLTYWCMADEVGESGTYHTHLYFVGSKPYRFSTVQKRFKGAHIERCRGTSQENKDYVFKQGKHAKEKKSEGHLPETREEYGQMPLERQGHRDDYVDLKDAIEQGMTNDEILEEFPKYMLQLNKIDRVRQTLLDAKHGSTVRNVDVTYIYGETGTGKTRSLFDQHGYKDVYRVTSYKNPFDGYKGQKVIAFEEFRSSLKIQDMLCHIDIHPHDLPCRYSDKKALFTKVYIISNIPLIKQYPNVQQHERQTWDAFLRRISRVIEFTHSGVVEKSVFDELCMVAMPWECEYDASSVTTSYDSYKAWIESRQKLSNQMKLDDAITAPETENIRGIGDVTNKN